MKKIWSVIKTLQGRNIDGFSGCISKETRKRVGMIILGVAMLITSVCSVHLSFQDLYLLICFIKF